MLLSRHFLDEPQDRKEMHNQPIDSQDQWRFTPLLESNSFTFPSFANNPSGYYTPTLGGSSTMYHNGAGDLHTPNMAFHLGTPMSMPTTDSQIQPPSALDMHAFHPNLLSSFQPSGGFPEQQSYAPSSFVHQDSGFEAMDASNDITPKQEMSMDLEMQRAKNLLPFARRSFNPAMTTPAIKPTEKYAHFYLENSYIANPAFSKFRYHVTLNAPTAMVRHLDEIPITYLNKGQAYSISISDSQPIIPSTAPFKYRTVIRISFEDEQQRQRPSACWQLWKEGRGLAEAHLRGGRLQAVEHVDPIQGGDEDTKRPRVELQSSSFDCFSVVWTPMPNTNTADCSVGVRFNFLSTDFSHSKGVKGIPVRLCAKTEVVSSGTPDSPPGSSAEVAFCKVKLFRDHGAERKLSNDIAHIRKTIDKLKHQIAQVESGASQSGKRKRSGSKGSSNRPTKALKHTRSWSVSSQNSNGRPVIDDDLHTKLASTEDMFSSTRPVSVLNLKGYPQDDPDAFPVQLPGHVPEVSKIEPLSRKTSWDRRQSAGTSQTTPTTTCIESPTPSSRSTHSHLQSGEPAALQGSTPYAPPQLLPEDWDQFPQFPDNQLHSLAVQPTTEPQSQVVKVQKGQPDVHFPDWFEALGVDPAYQAPPERPIKPIACFYVLIKVMGAAPENDYYRAVYLMERTVKDLINSIATKCQIDATRVSRTIRVNLKGLRIMVDDEVVRELPEGQDMAVEFSKIESTASLTDDQGVSSFSPLELRLLF